MRHLVLAIALTAFGGASHAAANVPGYNCQGYAEDPVAGSVTVDLHLDANGAPGPVISSWMPPAQASALIKGAPVYDAALMIGDGGEALLTISALARPGARSTRKRSTAISMPCGSRLAWMPAHPGPSPMRTILPPMICR